MMMFVPSLTAGAAAHGSTTVVMAVSAPSMVDCHEVGSHAAPVADCCDEDGMAGGMSTSCALACLSMAGACAAPVLPVASLTLPALSQTVMLPQAADEPFASIYGAPDTPPPKA
ncbi:MAG: hypothetical protein KBC57_03770 [Neisseriaceae bacterium]|nr:hypothetical protein [Neisseriaceae bacterium]